MRGPGDGRGVSSRSMRKRTMTGVWGLVPGLTRIANQACRAHLAGMTVAQRIRAKLEAAFAPTRLAIFDDSHRHHGHAGARPGGESHFRIELVSARFAGQSRVERQRTVYAALAEELAGPVHALQLSALSPEEDSGQSADDTHR